MIARFDREFDVFFKGPVEPRSFLVQILMIARFDREFDVFFKGPVEARLFWPKFQ